MIFTEQVGLQNVYTPLPFGIHLALCIFATVVFLVQFFRKNRVSYLLAALAVDATLSTHFAYENEKFILILEIVELLLILGCIIDIVLNYINNKTSARRKRKEKADMIRQQKEREKKEEISEKEILDNAFDSEFNELDGNE